MYMHVDEAKFLFFFGIYLGAGMCGAIIGLILSIKSGRNNGSQDS